MVEMHAKTTHTVAAASAAVDAFSCACSARVNANMFTILDAIAVASIFVVSLSQGISLIILGLLALVLLSGAVRCLKGVPTPA